MGRTYETSEDAKEDFLKTHYYKAFSDKMMDFIPDLLTKKFGFKVMAVNNDYNEICAYSNAFDITVKVIGAEINKTAVDFFITNRSLFDFGKTKNMILAIYEAISKEYEFLGLSLSSGTNNEQK